MSGAPLHEVRVARHGRALLVLLVRVRTDPGRGHLKNVFRIYIQATNICSIHLEWHGLVVGAIGHLHTELVPVPDEVHQVRLGAVVAPAEQAVPVEERPGEPIRDEY